MIKTSIGNIFCFIVLKSFRQQLHSPKSSWSPIRPSLEPSTARYYTLPHTTQMLIHSTLLYYWSLNYNYTSNS